MLLLKGQTTASMQRLGFTKRDLAAQIKLLKKTINRYKQQAPSSPTNRASVDAPASVPASPNPNGFESALRPSDLIEQLSFLESLDSKEGIVEVPNVL